MATVLPSTVRKLGRKDVPGFHPDDLKIIKDKKHPLYDPRADLPIDADFVDNIREIGIIEPVGVWMDGETPWVIYGLQRVKTAQFIFAKYGQVVAVPVLLKKGTEKEMLCWKISENAQRVDMDPITKAEFALRYMNLGATEQDAATTLRIGTPSNLRLLLALNDLDPKLQTKVRDGEIGSTLAARELAKLPRDPVSAKIQGTKTQWEVYEELAAAGTLKGAAAAEAIRNVRAKSDGDGTPAKRMRTRPALERFRHGLKSASTDRARHFSATVSWLLGKDNAFAEWPEIAAIAEEAMGPRKKKAATK